MIVLQGNVQHSRLATDLLSQIVAENKVQMALISEPYTHRRNPAWLYDASGYAGLWAADTRNVVAKHGFGDGYVWATCRGITFVSCYFSPNDSMQEFREKLDSLEDMLRVVETRVVVAGDFNARALEWGMPRQNSRGRLIMEMTARLGLVVLNTGSTPTYSRPGFGESIPDVCMASEGAAGG